MIPEPISIEDSSRVKISEMLREFIKPVDRRGIMEYLGIKKEHTLDYYNARGLPRFKVGNEMRYYIPDVIDYFRARSVKREKYSYETQA